MFHGKAKTVSEYLTRCLPSGVPLSARCASFVKKHLPEGYKEDISWGIITYLVPLESCPTPTTASRSATRRIAALKNHYSLYLMNVYGDPKRMKWMADEFKKRGKKLDMGKSCVRFKSLDDLPLDVVGEVIASMSMDRYIAIYKASRLSAKGARKAC